MYVREGRGHQIHTADTYPVHQQVHNGTESCHLIYSRNSHIANTGRLFNGFYLIFFPYLVCLVSPHILSRNMKGNRLIVEILINGSHWWNTCVTVNIFQRVASESRRPYLGNTLRDCDRAQNLATAKSNNANFGNTLWDRNSF